jgi:hypothetical protein
VVDVLYVPELQKSFLSVSAMEDKGYTITFEDGQVLIRSRGSSLDSAKVLVTERAIYIG